MPHLDPSFPAVVPGTIGGTPVQTVNARDLHGFLKVGKDFSTWIKDRIAAFGFVEGSDFVIAEDLRSPDSGSAKARAQISKEYALSIHMAKELAMVQNNDEGRAARRHFIECERRLLAVQGSPPAIDVRNPAQLAAIALQLVEVNRELTSRVAVVEAKNQAMQPKVLAHARLAATDGEMLVTDAAKTIGLPRKAFLDHLFDTARLCRGAGGTLRARDAALKAALLIHRTVTVELPGGFRKVETRVYVTPKGLALFAEELCSQHRAQSRLF